MDRSARGVRRLYVPVPKEIERCGEAKRIGSQGLTPSVKVPATLVRAFLSKPTLFTNLRCC